MTHPFSILIGFPGGKQEPGESLEECLQRELREELDIQVLDPQFLLVVNHRYPGINVELHFFLCDNILGIPRPIGCSELTWVDPLQLKTFSFPKADKEVIHKIEQIHLASIEK